MRKIKLTKGQYALVSNADYEWLNQWKWVAARRKHRGYSVQRTESIWKRGKVVRRRHVSMARLILGLRTRRITADHKNRNPLDNRRSNLRRSTMLQQCQNRGMRSDNKSGLKGVGFNKYLTLNPWRAVINVGKKPKHIGYYATKEQAHAAYCKEAKKAHKEFASFG